MSPNVTSFRTVEEKKKEKKDTQEEAQRTRTFFLLRLGFLVVRFPLFLW